MTTTDGLAKPLFSMYFVKTDATLFGSSALAGDERKVGAARRRQKNTAVHFFMGLLGKENFGNCSELSLECNHGNQYTCRHWTR
jgi:hypothetical protein